MKKLFAFALFALFAVYGICQTYTPDGRNINYTGYIKLPGAKTKIGGVSLSGTDVTDMKSAVTKINSGVEASTALVFKADSNYRKAGSYVPMYDYRVKPTDQNVLKAYKARGSGIKIMPLSLSGFSSQYTMTDGEAIFALCYLRDTTTLTSFKYMLSQVSSGATFDNTNAFAVYSLSGSTATKIAETPNTTSIWTQTAFTVGSVNLSTPVVLPPGFYYLTVLFNTSVLGTAPKLYVSDQGLLTFLSQTNVGIAGSRVLTSFPDSFDISLFSNQQYVAGIFGF